MKTSGIELKGTTKRCITCDKEFYVKPSHVDRAHFCSLTCRRNETEVRNMKTAIKNIDKVQLTPALSAQIRGQIANFVNNQIVVANDVVMNGKEWSPTPARVFGMLLNKVVPDLNASFHQHEHDIKNITEMTRQELEAIASGAKTIEAEIVEDVD